MRYEVVGEYKDGTLELEDEAGGRYTAKMERDEDGLVVAIVLEAMNSVGR